MNYTQNEKIEQVTDDTLVVGEVLKRFFPVLVEFKALKCDNYSYWRIAMETIIRDLEPNYWLSCMIIDSDVMCPQVRGEQDVLYTSEHCKSGPTEILDAIASINAEGRPIWKPMHMQPIYRLNLFITR